MDFHQGDWVLVNLAPFIGSSRRSKNRIPCRVLAADSTHVEVCTEEPFRELSLRVPITWIEGKLESEEGQPDLRSSRAVSLREAAVFG
jgi:hypothetical protein